MERIAIGITGGIGTGKSTVSRYIKEKGYPVLDADAMSRQVVAKGSPALAEIADEFGDSVLTEEGELDRGRLAEIAFAHPEMKQKMECIITKRIIDLVAEEIMSFRENGLQKALFLDAPTLYETGADSLVDAVWLVTADHETRIRRCMERDGSTREQVESRMRSQMPEEEKILRADEVLDNSGEKTALYQRIDGLLEKYVPEDER